jgi:cytochrome b involved in lipid metabolism
MNWFSFLRNLPFFLPKTMSHSPDGDPTLTVTHSPEEVSKHNHAADMWIIIDREVYGLSQFAKEHPGGMKSK